MSNYVAEQSLDEIVSRVFSLLRQKGPLCPCQISVDLLLPPREVLRALFEMEKLGMAAVRPDRGQDKKYDKNETAWGLSACSSRRTNRGK